MTPVIKLHQPQRDVNILLDPSNAPAVRFGHMLSHADPHRILSLTATTVTGEVVALPVNLLADLLKERLILTLENKTYALTPVN